MGKNNCHQCHRPGAARCERRVCKQNQTSFFVTSVGSGCLAGTSAGWPEPTSAASTCNGGRCRQSHLACVN